MAAPLAAWAAPSLSFLQGTMLEGAMANGKQRKDLVRILIPSRSSKIHLGILIRLSSSLVVSK